MIQISIAEESMFLIFPVYENKFETKRVVALHSEKASNQTFNK